MCTFISEDGAVDSLFSAGISKLSPNKESVSIPCSKADLFSRATEEFWLSAVPVKVATVVLLIEFTADFISIFSDIPNRFHTVFA
jgi:hypothetical protein